MPELVATCPVCSRAAFSPVEKLTDGTSYHACDGCGLVLMNPRPTAAELAEYYQQVYWGERTSDSYKPGHWAERKATDVAAQCRKQAARATHIGTLLRQILPAAGLQLADIRTVLEIGSGLGETLRHLGALLEAEGGHPRRYAIEPNDTARAAAANNYRGVALIGRDIDEINRQPLTFDLIVLSHVLEHLTQPVRSLAAVRERLSERGLFYVEVPNYYGHPAVEFAHNFCFTPLSLQNMLRAAGFRVVDLRLTGHHEDFPFYLAAIAAADGSASQLLQRETVESVRSERARAMSNFREFRARTPRAV